jgi:hypothetical protein
LQSKEYEQNLKDKKNEREWNCQRIPI